MSQLLLFPAECYITAAESQTNRQADGRRLEHRGEMFVTFVSVSVICESVCFTRQTVLRCSATVSVKDLCSRMGLITFMFKTLNPLALIHLHTYKHTVSGLVGTVILNCLF